MQIGQVIGIGVMVLMGLVALFGTLVLLRRARAWERFESKRDEIEQLALARFPDATGVVVSPAVRLQLRTEDGTFMESYVRNDGHEHGVQMAHALFAKLRAPGGPPARRGDDAPPSETSREQLAAAAAADGHAARSLRALQQHADATVADAAAEEQRRDQRRASYRGPASFVPVIVRCSGGSHGSSGHAA